MLPMMVTSCTLNSDTDARTFRRLREAELFTGELLSDEDVNRRRPDNTASSGKIHADRVRTGCWSRLHNMDSVALKVQRITNLDDKVIDPRALGVAYAVFRNKCAHITNMARATEPDSIMRHGC
ncbi:hypothetical protein V3C99_017894 [Haemonchus contortus]